MNVREATAADVPVLDVIRRQAIEAAFTDEYDRAAFADLVASPDDRLPEWVADPAWVVLVAESDVTAVGYGAVNTATGEVGALYTAPEHQGRGCGSTLLAQFERRAREGGRDRLHAAVPRTAVGFFEGRGFERGETVERDGDVRRVRVEKSLAQG
ncbi:GNAT family N-acetyltransferase [Halomicroarcula sp. F13]|uniref:GNAT family N-acetyltransferase n=1 Tax=Haloarcula rubra TaxID=2487747 RepID=A0AAW4PND9_9EURY|nr:GNAT family N-acetyltransferase [Halomicroarcula rubra]MBX0321943.1 GNAT family N-acetyltransferase [Halomicroarcula rubra]